MEFSKMILHFLPEPKKLPKAELAGSESHLETY